MVTRVTDHHHDSTATCDQVVQQLWCNCNIWNHLLSSRAGVGRLTGLRRLHLALMHFSLMLVSHLPLKYVIRASHSFTSLIHVSLIHAV